MTMLSVGNGHYASGDLEDLPLIHLEVGRSHSATIALLTYATLAGFATFTGQTDVDGVTLCGRRFRLDALQEQRYTSAPIPSTSSL